jgi:genome maintenance exonuclease 1
LPSEKLERVEIEGKRHYITPEGAAYKSVTTILGEKLNKDGLEKWKKRVGEEEAKKVSLLAARRGTAVHDIAEKYLLNEEGWSRGAMPANVETFKMAKKVLDEHVDVVYGIELFLYSDELMTAGATDVVAEYDGIKSIIDFKTSKNVKTEAMIESYFLQATCYALMAEERYGIEVPQIVIIIMVDDAPEPLVFRKDKSQYVDRVREIFS